VKLESFTVGAFQENCYLVTDEVARVAALVDPGDEGAVLLDAVQRSGCRLEAIWLTHAHVDHIGAIAEITRQIDVPIFMHEADLPVYRAAPLIAERFGLAFELGPLPNRTLREGDVLSLGSLQFAVWHMPGHAPGHVVMHGHGVVFGGDVLFAGSVGRTDLPLSDGAAFQRTLVRMTTLPEETVVLPGHGPETTIGAEVRTNPFLTGLARPLRR